MIKKRRKTRTMMQCADIERTQITSPRWHLINSFQKTKNLEFKNFTKISTRIWWMDERERRETNKKPLKETNVRYPDSIRPKNSPWRELKSHQNNNNPTSTELWKNKDSIRSGSAEFCISFARGDEDGDETKNKQKTKSATMLLVCLWFFVWLFVVFCFCF